MVSRRRAAPSWPLSSAGLIGALIVSAELSEARTEKRIATLEKEVEGKLDGREIAADVACKLGEIKVLEGGYSGREDAKKFDCALAKLVKDGEDAAVLENMKVKFGSSHTAALAVCLKRGQRWAVDRVVSMSTGCKEPPSWSARPSSSVTSASEPSTPSPPTASASASASTSASASVRPRRR